MTSLELSEDRELLLAAHGVLSDIDPARFRHDATEGLRARLLDVARRMANRRRLEPLRAVLESGAAQLPTGASAPRKRWMAFKRRVQPVYASAAASLRAEAVHVPSLRPTNYARSLMHVGAALAALLAIEVSPSPWLVLALALGFASVAWTCEVVRRRSVRVNAWLMRLFGPVAHQHEHQRVNSATWYATALVALAATGSSVLPAVAVTVLGVGDPMAGLVGRRFGRHRLVHGRSLEGTLAFFASAALAAFVLLRALHGTELSLTTSLAVAVTASLAGALAELFSLRLDDNLSVPLSAAAGAALALASL